MDTNKPLEEKTIIERYTNPDNKFRIDLAFLELERINKDKEIRIQALEEAMAFMVDYYKSQKVDIILPDSLDDKGNTKLIL